jgi:hypothetical protein
MQPINYGVEIQDPTQSFLSAFKTGAAIQDVGLKQQQQQQQMANQKVILDGLAKIRQPGATVDDVANLAMILPKDQSETVLKAFALKTDAQKQNALSSAGKVVSALFAGENDIAQNYLTEQAAAMRNSGNEEGAKFLETWRGVTEVNPTASQNFFTAELLRLPGGDKIVENIIKLGGERRAEAKAPAELTEAQAKAQSAAVAAKFAESNAVKDLERKGWDITKIQSDMAIAKQNAKIAAMNAATSRESNAIKREENQLRLREMIDKRDTAVREKAAEVESARADMDNFLNTADRILATPKSVIGSAAGPVSARMPTLSQDTADFEALVETLGSQAFMSQIPKMKGSGALSEREGDKLQASLQNLSLKQSPERLIENVKESQRLILKARSTLSKKSGLPDTIPDTPAVQTNATDIDALLKKYGGTK